MTGAWTPQEPPARNGFTGAITPDEVLYFYEQPLLFTVKMGVFEALCYKADELQNTDLYLLSTTNEHVLDALKQGAISIKGALSAPGYWLVEVSRNLVALSSWYVPAERLPDEYLPDAGVGIQPHDLPLPDSVAQANAFFAVKFSGQALGVNEISFKLFRELTDRVYNATRKLFTPASLSGLRSGDVFDFPLAPPKFASLLIAIKRPVVDVKEIQRRRKEQYIPEDFIASALDRRSHFFDRANEIVSEAMRGEVTDNIASHNFGLLEAVQGLIPTDDTDIATTEFNAANHGGAEYLLIDANVGEKMRRAYTAAVTRPVTLRGRVELLNGKSSTFVLQDHDSGRMVTCYIGAETFEQSTAAQQLRYGAEVHITGNITKRDVRDYLVATADPVFPPPN
jgi:hypothetical protein